jgi:plastocyanin
VRTFTLIAVLLSLTLPLAACGGDDEETEAGSSGGGRGGETLKIAADPGGALEFDKSSLTANAGKVTIVMDNPSDLPHAVEIEGSGVEVAGDTVMKGGVSEASADLKAGEYEFYCPVDGHKQGGMEGTLTVN